ncbi:MAG: oxygen-dependent coproporphyrinogen oxidase [Acidimicrobiia bacterium]
MATVEASWPATADVEAAFRAAQDRFCRSLEAIDGGAFTIDRWDRPGGGGGETRVLAGDGPIEQAAVNVSAVYGPTPATLGERMAGVVGDEFYATGLSIIVHPANPHASTFHANVRHFRSGGAAWFGGGADLTPYYLYTEDAVGFHRAIADICDRHAVADHAAWKRACDDYFHLPHRGEHRGVGGIFFDHLTERPDEAWAFVTDLADHLADLYVPILERRVGLPVTEDQRRWHELRRGRYVEFNLVWDRGTRFGLETNGRTASILASLPPRARWQYEDLTPEPGTPEAELLTMVRGEPKDWLA